MYLTTGTAIDLDIDAIKETRNVHLHRSVRLCAALKLIDSIERQLSEDERQQLTEGTND